jgi:hypothetical protein
MGGNIRQALFPGTNREFEIVFDQLEFLAYIAERIGSPLKIGNFALKASCDCRIFLE